MHPEVIAVAAVVTIPAAVAVMKMWFKHQERMVGLTHGARSTPALEARLERLEQSVDAIAVEMERVGEGQRFLTRILSERNQALGEAKPASRGQVITPH